MPLTKSEARTLRGLESDAKKLANQATKLAKQAKTKLLREMRKS